jgi:hypothetical protein
MLDGARVLVEHKSSMLQVSVNPGAGCWRMQLPHPYRQSTTRHHFAHGLLFSVDSVLQFGW